ncbi:MAG: hypothetical protein V4640_13930 [Verrucomicrobiota bacterium]
MKTSFAFLLAILVGIASFWLGKGKILGQKPLENPAINTRTAPSPTAADAATKADPPPFRIGSGVLTTGTAAKMTPEERVALLKKAALLADAGTQADILCGLISAMTQEELMESTQVLLDAQFRGNTWSQEVWNSLWTQWGRVNAVACLELSQQSSNNKTWNGFKGLNTTNDYRCLMAGWLETNPEEAMAWAKLDKGDIRSAVGAAYAITHSADGDLGKLETAMLGIAANKLTVQACFEDYFDLAATSVGKPSPASLYDGLAPALQAAAWPAVVERLSQTDTAAAADWLENHADDPGYDARATYGLVAKMMGKDPAKAVQWAATLPASDNQMHPAVVAVRNWLQRDRTAANAWLKTQPADAPWATPFQPQSDPADPFAEPTGH